MHFHKLIRHVTSAQVGQEAERHHEPQKSPHVTPSAQPPQPPAGVPAAQTNSIIDSFCIWLLLLHSVLRFAHVVPCIDLPPCVAPRCDWITVFSSVVAFLVLIFFTEGELHSS